MRHGRKQFSEVGIQMSGKAVFKCSISLEMQIKTTLQFHLSIITMAKMKKEKQKGERVALIFEGM